MTEPLKLWDLATERAFLGAVWQSAGRAMSDTEITVEDFQHGPHRRLFQAFVEMHANGTPFDAAGVHTALGNDVPQVAPSLAEVVTVGVAAASAGWYADTLIRYTTHRRAVEAAARITQKANGQVDPDELAEFARGQIDQAMTPRGSTPVETWIEQLDRAESRWQTPVTDAIPTGWHDLDELLSGGGLRPGHLTVVGARPGVGKSLVATMLAGKTAAAGHGVYFASVEMSSDELTDRIAAAATGVPLSDITNRSLSNEQIQSMKPALKRIASWPLTLDDRVSTVAHIKRGARNKTRESSGLGLVIVDYLQLLASPDTGKIPRHEVVAGMSRSMKLMAREFNVPVVLLSQLNRGSVQRESKQPMISDLRESGAVEQDADEIILLHRDEDDADLAGQIQLHLAKNRHAATGIVRLAWKPYVSRITNMSPIGGAA